MSIIISLSLSEKFRNLQFFPDQKIFGKKSKVGMKVSHGEGDRNGNVASMVGVEVSNYWIYYQHHNQYCR